MPNPFVIPSITSITANTSVNQIQPPTAQAAPSAVEEADEQRRSKPFNLWKPSQFLEYIPNPSACLLGDGYIEKGEWTSLIGIGGLGKTRLALWLAVSQMTQRQWCGLETRGEPQKTTVLSTENGVRRWKHDLEKIFAALTVGEQAVVDEHLRIMALTAEDDGDMCLSNPETACRLKATFRDERPGFVVFDPFADMIDGDENKTSDVVQTLRLLRGITRDSCADAAVLIIHHARSGAANVAQAGDNFNAGNFGRGSKALYSRVRCEIQLAPQDRDDANRLVLACGKANNAVKFAPRGVLFDPETFTYTIDEAFSVEAWRHDVAGKRKQSAVSIVDLVTAIRELGGCPGDEIATTDIHKHLAPTGVTLRTLQREIRSAVKAGYIRDGKKRGLWRLGTKPLRQ